MAGIGFKLNRMMKNESISGNILAFTYSTIISAGPWIITSFTLYLLLSKNFFLRAFNIIANITNFFGLTLTKTNTFEKIVNDYFSVALVYSFVFSTLMTGGVLMVISRVISDNIYLKKYDNIFSDTLNIIFFTNIVAIISAVVFFMFNPNSPLDFKLSFIYLLVSLCTLWISAVSAVSTDDYGKYLIGFAISGFSSLILAFILGYNYGYAGSIFGYGLGISAGSSYMLFTIGDNFGYSFNFDFTWFNGFKLYWTNLLIGTFYYFALWIDDLMTWYSNYGRSFKNIQGFRLSFIYDSPMFVAYFSTIPTMAMFVLVLETYFYKKYKAFYNTIIEGGSYTEIEYAKKDMIVEMKSNISMVIKFQLIITVILFLINEILDIMGMITISSLILRIAVVGAFLNGIYLMITLLLLYFDFRKEVIYLHLMTFLINLISTPILLNLYGINGMGYGYTIAFLIGTYVGYNILLKKLDKIIQIEFNRQKTSMPKGYVVEYEDIKKYVEEK